MIRSESSIDENKKRPERAPERPPWRYCASVRTGFDGLLQSVADSVVPVFVFAVATAS